MSYDQKGKPADFVIKHKDPETGKYMIVGRAWKKTGPYGPFLSLSIGPKENRTGYLMVKAPEPRPQDAVRTGPPKQMPEKIRVPSVQNLARTDPFDDL